MGPEVIACDADSSAMYDERVIFIYLLIDLFFGIN